MEKSKSSLRNMISPFIFTALGWLFLSQLGCRLFSTSSDQAYWASLWALAFWILSVCDLVVMGKLVSCITRLLNSNSEMRTAYSVQALCWGLFKIVCLGLFIIVLLKGQKIPMHGLLLGMGTLIIVPLIGGFVWSQRVLSNA